MQCFFVGLFVQEMIVFWQCFGEFVCVFVQLQVFVDEDYFDVGMLVVVYGIDGYDGVFYVFVWFDGVDVDDVFFVFGFGLQVLLVVDGVVLEWQYVYYGWVVEQEVVIDQVLEFGLEDDV